MTWCLSGMSLRSDSDAVCCGTVVTGWAALNAACSLYLCNNTRMFSMNPKYVQTFFEFLFLYSCCGRQEEKEHLNHRGPEIHQLGGTIGRSSSYLVTAYQVIFLIGPLNWDNF